MSATIAHEYFLVNIIDISFGFLNVNMSGKIKFVKTVDREKFYKPFQYGWKREVVCGKDNVEIFYINSVGQKFRTKNEIDSVLKEDELDIDMFSFAKKPLGFDEELVRHATSKGYSRTLPILKERNCAESQSHKKKDRPIDGANPENVRNYFWFSFHTSNVN